MKKCFGMKKLRYLGLPVTNPCSSPSSRQAFPYIVAPSFLESSDCTSPAAEEAHLP